MGLLRNCVSEVAAVVCVCVCVGVECFFGKCSSPDNACGRLKSYLCTLSMFTVKGVKKGRWMFFLFFLNK